MPWPIARVRALEIVRVFDFAAYARIEEVVHECESMRPPDRGQLFERWRRWREGLIKRYILAGYVPPETERE